MCIRDRNKAYDIANTGRKGPVLIDLPMNIQRGEISDPVYHMEDLPDRGQNRDESAKEAAKCIWKALDQA